MFTLDVVCSVTLEKLHCKDECSFSSGRLSEVELRNVRGPSGAIDNIIMAALRMETLILAGSPYSEPLKIEFLPCLHRLFILLRPDDLKTWLGTGMMRSVAFQ